MNNQSYRNLEIHKIARKLVHNPAFRIRNPVLSIQDRVSRKGFTLIEVMVALAVFAVIIASAGSVFISIQQAWQRQKQTVELIQNARWAMEFMSNEIRGAGQILIPPPDGGQLEFRTDPDNNGFPPYRTIDYQKTGAVLQRRWRQSGGWQPWQELANLIINNPSGNNIFTKNGSLITIELTVEEDSRQYTLKTQVRLRN